MSLLLTLVNASIVSVDTPLKQFNGFKYETPTGRQMKVPQKTELIVVAFEKDTGKLVNEYLKSKNPLYMPKHHAIFVADIHNMPSIITNMFALPKLRKYKHLIYLHFDDEFENFVPNKEEKITVIRLKDKKVVSVSFISTADELKEVIEK